MSQIQIKVSGDRQVLQVIGGLTGSLNDIRPVLAEIGEEMAERTRQRFDTLTGPDGQPWAANAESTFEQYLGRFRNSYNKDGTLSATGEKRKAGKKPLTGETKALRTTINYQLVGNDTVSIGSPMDYAPYQQYGTPAHTILPKDKKALAFGGIVVRKVNHPGIPARPFLGFSDQDQADITDIVRGYFKPPEK